MTNLVAELGATADRHGEATAVAYAGSEVPYTTLWERTGRFAAALADHGIEPGDRVALYLPNLPQFVTAFHGTLRAGGVVVPMNPQYGGREIEHLLADSATRVVVALADLVPAVEEVRDDTAVERIVAVGDDAGGATPYEEFLAPDSLAVVERGDDDVAVQPYTSGTTGRPKGALLTHRNLTSNARTMVDLSNGIDPEDGMLGVLPLFHIYGMTVTMNAPLFGGGSYHPLPRWDVERAVALVEREALTMMHGVPAMYNDVVEHPDAESFDLSSLRLAGVGGAGLPVEVLRRFEDLFETTIYEGYGLTETSPVTHFNSPKYGRRVGSIGLPIPGVDAMIVDDDFEAVPRIEEGPVDEDRTDLDAITGEIVVAGPNVMLGYDGLPEANAEAFIEVDGTRWFHTGDVGYWDADDYFYVVDRKTHAILSGGYTIYPREIEDVVHEHPAVADVAVVGVPDERRGEVPAAFVVPTPGADAGPEAIEAHCADELAAYKRPREVTFVEELPRTTTGKVRKFELGDADDGAS